MATSTRALAFRFGGWTGGITVNNGTPTTVTAEAFASALSAAVRLDALGPAWLTVRLASSGRLQVVSSGGNFTMTGTGNVLTRLGFTGSYSGAATYSGAVLPTGCHTWRGMDPVTFDEAAAVAPARAVGLYNSHVRRARGAQEWRRPRIAGPVTLAQWLAFLEDWDAYLTTPAEIDVGYEMSGALTATTVQVDGASVRVRDTKTGFGEVTVSATEAVP